MSATTAQLLSSRRKVCRAAVARSQNSCTDSAAATSATRAAATAEEFPGHTQRADAPGALAAYLQGCAAGGQHHDLRAARQHICDQRAGGCAHLLAVVQHDQRGTPRQVVEQARGGVAAAGVHPQCAEYGSRHPAGVVHLGQFDPPDAAGEILG